MTAEQFVIWLKGVVDGSHDYAPTPKVWDKIKEELDKVVDEPQLFNPSITPSNPYPLHPEPPYYIGDGPWWQHPINRVGVNVGIGGTGVTNMVTSESLVTALHNTSGSTTDTARMVWNDQIGAWHYTNYPEGFGFYTNSTADNKKEQQQLND